MRGRWASAAIGAGVARRRAGEQIEQSDQAHEQQMQQAQQQIEAQQRQIEQLQQQRAQPAQQGQPAKVDITEKLKEYGELKKQGLLTEEEFQRLKTELLARA
ncbi:MAG: SHOCT domain-containing protein [Nitrososphaera sp.]|jgi:chromosome segregation ATPase